MMKRYYFDLREGDDIAPDDEGMELPTIEEGGDHPLGYGGSEARRPVPHHPARRCRLRTAVCRMMRLPRV